MNEIEKDNQLGKRATGNNESLIDEELDRIFKDFMKTGKVDPAQLNNILLNAAGDDSKLEAIMGKLKSLGADQLQGESQVLKIADYYKEGEKKFELLWPLHPSTQSLLPFPFRELDRKTQFFSLFTEWSRRELEGTNTLNNGETSLAEKTFNECLQRAEQIEVYELMARSYEGLIRVAQKRGDRKAERDFSQKALEIRAKQNG